jgi:hypothetical protein
MTLGNAHLKSLFCYKLNVRNIDLIPSIIALIDLTNKIKGNKKIPQII